MNEMVFKISWEQHLIQFVFWLIIFSILIALKGLIGWIAIVLAMLWTVWVFIKFLEAYTAKFVVDDEGVWLYSGLFPWNKGRYGLNWRDISEAVYYTGFVSWALNSYRVTVKHRYTMDNQLNFYAVSRGRDMVILINNIVAEKDLY